MLFTLAYLRERRRLKALSHDLSAFLRSADTLPPAEDAAEAAYQNTLSALRAAMLEKLQAYSAGRQETEDFCTAWVHQIKTPIAVLRMRLDDENDAGGTLRGEVFRIEQYVDMVLQYIRLGSESTDLVIREESLDALIRGSIRKYASLFIEKKLKLCYTGTETTLVTDGKWFRCILDQLLSNAVKYTDQGTITIRVTDSSVSVTDTGIGIAAEDLPRIFEKGFTGRNGRIGQNASGLGLYLAQRAADLLAIRLQAESHTGKGSTFTLHF